MDNKSIQEQRIRSFFVESCKSIIRGEGLKGVSVRNVADEAGYSAATLYNYFKDIYALLNVCIEEFLDEVEDFVAKDAKQSNDAIESLRAKSYSFVKYFIQYPGIYELLFLEKISNLGFNPEISKRFEKLLTGMIDEEMAQLLKGNHSDDAELLVGMYVAMVQGYLLLYMNKRIPADFVEFKKRFDVSVVFFLNSLT